MSPIPQNGTSQAIPSIEGESILENLIVWITDFGLARFLNEAGLTLTGDLIGTPPMGFLHS